MNDNNLVLFSGGTSLDIPSDRVLTNAINEQIESVIVLGVDQDGMFYFAAASGDIAEVLLMLEKAKMELLEEVMN